MAPLNCRGCLCLLFYELWADFREFVAFHFLNFKSNKFSGWTHNTFRLGMRQ